MMSFIFYDFYWLLIFFIVLILGLILALGTLTVAYRLYKNWYFHRTDRLRDHFAPLVTNILQGEPLPETLKFPLKSIERSLIEELLLEELAGDIPHPNKHVLSAFDQLGYVDQHIGQLDHGNRWQQALAAEKLGHMRNSKAIAGLTKALDRPDVEGQTAAIQALGIIGGDAAAEALTRKLYEVSESNRSVSLRMLKAALVNFGPRIHPYMKDGLHHAFWRVRGAVVDILSEVSDPECAPDLRPMLTDPEQDIRAKASRALGRMKDEASIPLLIPLLKDPSWVVRLQASRSLGQFSHADAMTPLLHLMEDENWQVRAASAEAVRQYGTRSVKFLSDAISSTTDRYAREQLLEEIQRSGLLETYVETLIETATDGAIKPHAIVTQFIKHGTVSLLLHLMKNHSNNTVRLRLLNIFSKTKSPQILDAVDWLNKHDPDQKIHQSTEKTLQCWMRTEQDLQVANAKSI